MTLPENTHILVVDDDDHERLLLKTLLLNMPERYHVIAVSDGYEAIETIKHTTCALLLTDLHMPKMDGVTLTKCILEMCPHIIVIWLTAYGCHRYARAREQLPVYGCLEKPVEIDTIRFAVKDALAGTASADKGA